MCILEVYLKIDFDVFIWTMHNPSINEELHMAGYCDYIEVFV